MNDPATLRRTQLPIRVRSRSACVAALLLGTAGLAAADEPEEAPIDTAHHETGILPLVGGDTDNGFGGGAIGSYTQFDPAETPYHYQIQFGAFYAIKGNVLSPTYEDAYALITFPQLLDHKQLRVELRPSFTKDTALRYFGLGNRPPVPANTEPARDFYERLHPQLTVLTRWTISHPWSVLAGFGVTYNDIKVQPGSTLAADMAMLDPNFTKPHDVFRIETGVVYDTRDNELSPNHGMYHQLKLRESPRLGPDVPYSYQQINATARFYTTLIPKRLVLAVRGVFDVQVGNVPFYELARYEDTSAIGGGLAIRGVPAYAFYGKVKAFGNAELRAWATRFSFWDRHFRLGFAGFFDAGRLWSESTMKRTDLDGKGLGLHYGIGGGIRLQQGRGFLVRADVAWSPDAKPIGAYLLADQAF